MKEEIAINSLIKKYEEEIKRKKQILIDLTPNTKLEYYYLTINSELQSDIEFLKDLKALKEHIKSKKVTPNFAHLPEWYSIESKNKSIEELIGKEE